MLKLIGVFHQFMAVCLQMMGHFFWVSEGTIVYNESRLSIPPFITAKLLKTYPSSVICLKYVSSFSSPKFILFFSGPAEVANLQKAFSDSIVQSQLL